MTHTPPDCNAILEEAARLRAIVLHTATLDDAYAISEAIRALKTDTALSSPPEVDPYEGNPAREGMIYNPYWASPPEVEVERVVLDVAKALNPELFCGDAEREHRAASPYIVDHAKGVALAHAELAVRAALTAMNGPTSS